MKFFLDNCISTVLARGIAVLAEVQHYEIVHLRDLFPADISDVQWIQRLGEEADWVIVSGDTRISRNKAERLAWKEAGLTAFFFTDDWAQKKFWTQAAEMVRWWPTIVLEARRAATGSGFLVPARGRELRQIYSPSE